MVEQRGEIKLKGFKELHAALMEMPEKIRKKTLRSAQTKAAKVIADAAGDLLGSAGDRKDMGVAIRSYREGIRALVGPRMKVWYLKFREFGTSLHTIKAKKKRVLAASTDIAAGLSEYARAELPKGSLFKGVIFGKEVQVQQPARPFLRPAFDSHKQEYLDTLGKELKISIEETIKKHLKQAIR